MTYFPSIDESYYTDNDRSITQVMDSLYSQNITSNQSFWVEADNDNRFAAGDQNLFNEMYGGYTTNRSRQFSFNRIKRVLNMVSGYQRQHRKSTKVTPVESGAQKTADQFTKLLYHVYSHDNALETISDAFEGAITGGMNLLSTWIDYSTDCINGTIRTDNISYNSFLMDSFFRKKDLSDCNFIWTRKFLSRRQVMALLPGRENEIKDMRGCGNKDGKFNFIPESFNAGPKSLMVYDEFWYMDSRAVQTIVDTETGETVEWRGQDDDLKEFLSRYPQTIVVKNDIPSVKLAIVVQGKVMFNGPNPMGIDEYPFVPVWCYYNPQIPYYPLRIQGITRGLRDSQYLYSRSRINMLDIQESQINSGWIYKENALVNPKDVFLSGQGKGLALKAEAQMTDVMRIEPPQIPASMIQLNELLGQELTQISGVNEELLGSSTDNDKAGVLEMLRQGAGLVTLQPIFDNLDQSQRLLGKIHMKMIAANWTPGKVARIINEEPTEEFYNRAFSTYDAIVEEAPLTATQKQMALQQALYLREMGIEIPVGYLLENMQLPNKDKLIEEITANMQKAQQQQQQMEELQMQQLMVENETKVSYAEGQRALAAERLNKVNLDAALSAERIQRAEEDKTGAFLNLAKALKELEGMEISQIAEGLQIKRDMELHDREGKKHEQELASAQAEQQLAAQERMQKMAQEQQQMQASKQQQGPSSMSQSIPQQ